MSGGVPFIRRDPPAVARVAAGSSLIGAVARLRRKVRCRLDEYREQTTYDYRIQEAICESGDRDLFPELNIPRSTIRSWIHRGAPDVISCDLAAYDCAELTAEIERLQRRTALLGSVVGFPIAMLRVSNLWLDYERRPDGDAEKILLRSIERARKVLPLSAALRITRLSASP